MKKDIFIACVSYDGKISTKTTTSIMENILALKEGDNPVTLYFYNNDCYIHRARNTCISLFLKTESTDIVFIDSDVSFPGDSILKLFDFDKDVIAGVYPFRSDEYKKQFPFPVTFENDNGSILKDATTGLLCAQSVPAGFLRIKREVFPRMIEAGVAKKDKEGIYHFFDTGVLFDNDDMWYGDDVAFCKKWKNIGGEIHVVPDITFTHSGNKNFVSNLAEFIKG